MYMIESMIDLGLNEGQKWPSDMHRTVACNLALFNPLVTTRDQLTDICQKVIAIPKDKIKKVRWNELQDYGIDVHLNAS